MKQKAYSVCLVQLCFCFDCPIRYHDELDKPTPGLESWPTAILNNCTSEMIREKNRTRARFYNDIYNETLHTDYTPYA